MAWPFNDIHWNYCAHIESNHFYESDVELHMHINSNFWVRKADFIALEWIRAWWPIPHLCQNLDDFITELSFEKSYFLQGHGHLNGRRHKLTLFSLVAKMSAARYALSSLSTSAISRHLITVPLILSSSATDIQNICDCPLPFPPSNFDNFTLAGNPFYGNPRCGVSPCGIPVTSYSDTAVKKESKGFHFDAERRVFLDKFVLFSGVSKYSEANWSVWDTVNHILAVQFV